MRIIDIHTCAWTDAVAPANVLTAFPQMRVVTCGYLKPAYNVRPAGRLTV